MLNDLPTGANRLLEVIRSAIIEDDQLAPAEVVCQVHRDKTLTVNVYPGDAALAGDEELEDCSAYTAPAIEVAKLMFALDKVVRCEWVGHAQPSHMDPSVILLGRFDDLEVELRCYNAPDPTLGNSSSISVSTE